MTTFRWFQLKHYTNSLDGPMPWIRMIQTARGTAKGLDFLHYTHPLVI
jgi:hypothetical protein